MADLLTLSDCMVHTFVRERLMTEIPDTLTLHYYCLHSSHATPVNRTKCCLLLSLKSCDPAGCMLTTSCRCVFTAACRG